MKFVKAAFVVALAVTTAGAFTSRAEAAPLPTNVAAMKAALDTPVVQVRYGRWHGGWGYRGWGGYGGWGHRGWGACVRPTTALIPITEVAMPTVEAMLMIIVLPTVTRAIIPATARGIIMIMDGDFRPLRPVT